MGRGPLTYSAPAVLQNKLAGTVWTDIDDAKVFKVLDLEDLERTFSAYQRQQVRAGLGCRQGSGHTVSPVGSKHIPLLHTNTMFAKSLGLLCSLIHILVPFC